MTKLIAILLASLAAATALAAGEPLTLPQQRYITVKFVRVYDGDTVAVILQRLPAPLNRLRIRIQEIDTPEYGAKARCEAEAKAAETARAYLAEVLGTSKDLRVYRYRWDKYGGRILGDLRANGENVRDLMIRAGHAVPYSGSGPRQDWCQPAR